MAGLGKSCNRINDDAISFRLALDDVYYHLSEVLKGCSSYSFTMYTYTYLFRVNGGMSLVTTGIYGQVRHPTYSFLILNLWCTPQMVSPEFVLLLTLHMVHLYLDCRSFPVISDFHWLHSDSGGPL